MILLITITNQGAYLTASLIKVCCLKPLKKNLIL